MPLSTLECPHCGGPLSLPAGDVVQCAYCGRAIVWDPASRGATDDARWAMLVSTRDEDDSRDPRRWCRVGGQKLLVRQELGEGTSSEVFFAERAQHPTELVVFKVARAEDPKDPFAKEFQLLTRLAESNDPRATDMTPLLPQLVLKGTMRSRACPERPALVTRWRSGYLHTLVDVKRAFPRGVDARTAVWIWRRALTLAGWLHGRGVVHGALRPEHLIVHPRDHGLTFLGWSHAVSTDAPSARVRDLVDIGQSMRFVLAGSFPHPLETRLQRAIDGEERDADALSAAVKNAAREVWGPPSYHLFTMPGWRAA